MSLTWQTKHLRGERKKIKTLYEMIKKKTHVFNQTDQTFDRRESKNQNCVAEKQKRSLVFNLDVSVQRKHQKTIY